jgi:hypothetical protein
MKRRCDTVFAALGLVLGVVAMAGTILSGEYAKAAGAETRAVDALFDVVANPRHSDAGAPAVLVAMDEAAR